MGNAVSDYFELSISVEVGEMSSHAWLHEVDDKWFPGQRY